jgi:hypothetical protein
VPDTEQVELVSEVKLTVRPELAVALMAKGAVPDTRFGSAGKLIVWASSAGVTRKDCDTCGAAAYEVLPGWSAAMVQVSVANRRN